MHDILTHACIDTHCALFMLCMLYKNMLSIDTQEGLFYVVHAILTHAFYRHLLSSFDVVHAILTHASIDTH